MTRMNIATQQSVSLPASVSISRQHLLALSMAFCGFSSVGSLSLAMFQVGSLTLLFSFWVVPSILLISICGLALPELGRLCLKGWLAGLVAVFLYDVSRVPFILAGWDDFIPQIGVWLLGRESAPAALGYLYRYAGNGGGMGISFILLAQIFNIKQPLIKYAVIYGLAVFSCLMLTLIISPLGQDEMFAITPLTFSGSLLGHIIYGLVLGLVLKRLG